MRFEAYYDRTLKDGVPRGWRVIANYEADGGTIVDVCGATDEVTAWATARALQEIRE